MSSSGPPRAPYGQTGVGPPTRRSAGPSKYGQAQPPPFAVAPPPYARPPSSRQEQAASSRQSVVDPEGDGVVLDDEEYHDEPEQPQRQWKYSSANMRQTGNCRKYMCIALLFLVFLAFSIGISVLIDKLFFSESNSEPPPYVSPNNSTFPLPKGAVDSACGLATFNQDGGMKCKEVCQPQWSDCCDPFNPSEIYDFSGSVLNESVPDVRPEPEACSIGDNLMECMSYSKCTGSDGTKGDPSPNALPAYCSEPRFSEDPEACVDICSKERCCYGQPEYGSMHCLAARFQVCLDYAPCQNLRKGPILKTAPTNLDQLCFQQEDDCLTICEEAECCNLDAENSCFKDNVISCLTYAPCTYFNKTKTNVTVPPRFNTLPSVPSELDAACSERPQEGSGVSSYDCDSLCQVAECCYSENPDTRCFEKDPLGCIAWDEQCQVKKRFQPPT